MINGIGKTGGIKMGFCCADCGDSEHACTAWDGKGASVINGARPNHNLVEVCPSDIKKCEYRHKKIKSTVKV